MTLGEDFLSIAKIYCLTRLMMSQMIIKPGEIARLSSLRELRHLEIDPREKYVYLYNAGTVSVSDETELSKEDFLSIASLNKLTILWLGHSSKTTQELEWQATLSGFLIGWFV